MLGGSELLGCGVKVPLIRHSSGPGPSVRRDQTRAVRWGGLEAEAPIADNLRVCIKSRYGHPHLSSVSPIHHLILPLKSIAMVSDSPPSLPPRSLILG
jgi:hypothetical protein